jgi:sulfatase modifying factor 1
MKQVFLSYSRKDLKFVEKLAEDLQQAGYDVWYDLTDIEGGDRWAIEIQTAIDNSDVCITVISPNSIVSEWVEKEFLYASNEGKKIVPVFHKWTDLPLWLMNIHYIDVRGRNYKKNFPLLKAAIDDDEEAIISFEPVKRLGTFSPAWVGGIAGGVVLILLIIFGLPALTGGPASAKDVTPTETPTAFIPTLTPAPASETPVPSPTATTEITPTVTVIPTLAPEITDSKGAEMVLIPAGTFKMGCNEGAGCVGPAHVVELDDYYIDKFEVTNAQYLKCELDQQCEQPKNTRNYDNLNFSDHPVVFVNWNMAANFCAWRGARLPTESEWEKAARGIDLYDYPWGNRFDGNLLNFCDINCTRTEANRSYNDNHDNTAPVGIYEGGESPYGVYDMAGNVQEWAADWYNKEYYAISPGKNPTGPESGTYRVLRGGSWLSNLDDVRTYVRAFLSPTASYNYVGFRCAKSTGK